ncbi:MAG: RrF2 family transcriptional regulator [Ktedonobacterales bacterium]
MSRGTVYGPGWFLVAVEALAILADSGEPCSSHSMAQNLNAHAVFLRRVMAHLAHANLIQAREGRDGGYRLARPADQITLSEVYQAVKLAGPPEETACSEGLRAPVKAMLDEIGVQAEDYLLGLLSQQTLASVLERLHAVRAASTSSASS